MGKYLIKGSILRCNKGEKESKFNPDKKTVSVQGKPVGTTKDCKAGVHVKDFKGCALAGECKLATELMGKNLKWEKFRERTTIEGHNVITDESICRCPIGGTISVVDSTQIEGSAEKNALLGQVESLINQVIQKISDNVQEVKNNLGYENKKLTLKEKVDIYKTYEKTTGKQYFDNYEALFGKYQKNVLKHSILDEVLNIVRRDEKFPWASSKETLLTLLIFFMLLGLFEKYNIFLLASILSVADSTILQENVSLSATDSSNIQGSGNILGKTAIATTGKIDKEVIDRLMQCTNLFGLLLNLRGDTNINSIKKQESSDTSSIYESEDIFFSIGTVGYVLGADLGLGTFKESFDTIELEEFIRDVDELMFQLIIAINAGDKAQIQNIATKINSKFQSKKYSFETYIKYSKINDFEIYVGITGGIYETEGSPYVHVRNRDKRKDHRAKVDLRSSELDKTTGLVFDKSASLEPGIAKTLKTAKNNIVKQLDNDWGVNLVETAYDYMAIRGREQVLIEQFGGVKNNPILRNKNNSLGSASKIRQEFYKSVAYTYWGRNPENWTLPKKDLRIPFVSKNSERIRVRDLKKQLKDNYNKK